MDMLNRFSQRVTLCGCALLLCFSLSAGADEIQDINKLFKQGKQEQALVKVNAYLVNKPKDAQARFLKGLILTEQDKTTEAIRVFSELTEDFPELPEPYNNLAVLYANQGQYEKARTALEMAIRTNPSYATAHENLGDIYAKMASQAYDRALQLDHGNASTQTKLAMVKEIFAAGAGKGAKPGKSNRKTQVAAAPAAENAKSVTPVAPVAAAVTETPPVVSPQQKNTPATATATAALATAPVVSPEPVAVSEPVASPKPAATPTKRTVTHKSAAASSKEVLKRVHEWAAAWSSKNVKEYLAFYAEDFKIPGRESRAQWEEQRRERIRKPKSIKVGINNAKVEIIDDTHASVSFKQSYRASHLHTSTGKMLILVRSGDGWLIQEERTGK